MVTANRLISLRVGDDGGIGQLARVAPSIPRSVEREILTIEEAADWLRTKPKTLQNYIYEKRFTASDGLRNIGNRKVVHFPTLQARVIAGTLMTANR